MDTFPALMRLPTWYVDTDKLQAETACALCCLGNRSTGARGVGGLLEMKEGEGRHRGEHTGSRDSRAQVLTDWTWPGGFRDCKDLQ